MRKLFVVYIAIQSGLCPMPINTMWENVKMNMAKSEVVSVGNDSNVESMASIFGCKVSQLPMKYIGLLLGATFKSKAIWDDVLEKLI